MARGKRINHVPMPAFMRYVHVNQYPIDALYIATIPVIIKPAVFAVFTF